MTSQSSATPALPLQFAGGVVRRMHAGDLGTFQAYRSIPELGQYQGWAPMTDDQARAFIQAVASAPLFECGQWVQLGIADASTDELIGDIGLHLSADGQVGEVGFTLAPAAQRRGIATAAVREALALLFAKTSITHVRGVTDARNVASIRLLQRLGFTHVETQQAVFRGEECTEQVYVLQRQSSAPATVASA